MIFFLRLRQVHRPSFLSTLTAGILILVLSTHFGRTQFLIYIRRVLYGKLFLMKLYLNIWCEHSDDFIFLARQHLYHVAKIFDYYWLRIQRFHKIIVRLSREGKVIAKIKKIRIFIYLSDSRPLKNEMLMCAF